MNNIYVLTGNGNNNFDADENVVLLTERDFVLVECSFGKANELAREWGLEKPLLAQDGVWVSESGNELYIANGEIVDNVAAVANALGYNVADESGYSPADYDQDIEDFIRLKNRYF